jgi:hypothetical protein
VTELQARLDGYNAALGAAVAGDNVSGEQHAAKDTALRELVEASVQGQDKKGEVELAHAGTWLVDEIGAASPVMQSRPLQAIEDKWPVLPAHLRRAHQEQGLRRMGRDLRGRRHAQRAHPPRRPSLHIVNIRGNSYRMRQHADLQRILSPAEPPTPQRRGHRHQEVPTS